jgi:hypothetical protein
VVALVTCAGLLQFGVMPLISSEDSVKTRIVIVAAAALTALMLIPPMLRAQDVPGIEICTVEKTMERRTSCLQSNVDFLQKTITKLIADHQQKLDAANRQMDGLKSAMMSLQKTVDDLQSAQKKVADESKKKADVSSAKDSVKDPVKDPVKDAASAQAKDGAK